MAKKNVYFKHFNTASQGHTLATLWANGDTDAIALFWLLLELVSRFEDPEKGNDARGKITISWSVLAHETKWKPSKCRRVLARIVPVSEIEMTEFENGYVSFLVRNWLKFQETRGGKKEQKTVGTILSNIRGERREERVVEEKEQNSSPPPTGIQNFEAQFHPERERFESALRLISAWDSVRHHFGAFVARFRSYDEWREWGNGFMVSVEKKQFSSPSERSRYITVSILREIGAIEAVA
ncbi:MAG: hypothetical protein NDI61_09240 [Bdellovibrionaceae bacterium]|nr:hypothetical protein [Pseudobdellovibrionaceae bacterium]